MRELKYIFPQVFPFIFYNNEIPNGIFFLDARELYEFLRLEKSFTELFKKHISNENVVKRLAFIKLSTRFFIISK